MSASVVVQDSSTSNRATVTKYGQLVVAPTDYSTPKAVKLDVINTAFNFVEPVAGSEIVITDMILTANKRVGANDATIVVYEADEIDSVTSTNDILNLEMLKKTTVPLTGMNMLVGEGKFINATTDDNDVYITIMFYRVPVVTI